MTGHTSLSEMSNEELWQLFPILLRPHCPEWKEKYIREKAMLEAAIGPAAIVRINHIGSTCISGLTAKPTIDILLEIDPAIGLTDLIQNICRIGYLYTPQPDNPPPHMMYMKGYTLQGFVGQTFHLHVRYPGDWDELYFRDYLATHPSTADAYGKLKLSLKKRFEHDRDRYTEAKTDFIKTVTEKARKCMPGKYLPPLSDPQKS